MPESSAACPNRVPMICAYLYQSYPRFESMSPPGFDGTGDDLFHNSSTDRFRIISP